MNDLDYKSPYLTTGLIAYIGNKRSLLPFLGKHLAPCVDALASRNPPRFLDPFAGAGGVSRLAKALGFSVGTNDLEYYAALIGFARIVPGPGDLETAFSSEGGSSAVFSALHAFASGAAPSQAVGAITGGPSRDAWEWAFSQAQGALPYMARYYAPQKTENADWRRERLFYTAENARYLDRAREAIERRYPVDPLEAGEDRDKRAEGRSERIAKACLVDALLYQAATHTNTSGVFKACHRGFGGHGKDALGRIMAPMALRAPVLIDGPEATASRMDAAAFCASHPADLVYLDPPYNQHQYGSNYHILTTLARWDRPAVSEERSADGFLLDRSGIRRDWNRTRSLFCGKNQAVEAFKRLFDAIDARFILLSYNNGGIVPLELMADLLASRGNLRVEEVPYTAYRGGKQGNHRLERMRELLFILDCRSAPSPGIQKQLRQRNQREILKSLLASRFHPDRVRSEFPGGEFQVTDWGLASSADSYFDGLLSFERLSRENFPMEHPDLEAWIGRLGKCVCASHGEALGVVLSALEKRTPPWGTVPLDKRESLLVTLIGSSLALLRKIAFVKYASEYTEAAGRLETLLTRCGPAYQRWMEKLDRLNQVAKLRGVQLSNRVWDSDNRGFVSPRDDIFR